MYDDTGDKSLPHDSAPLDTTQPTHSSQVSMVKKLLNTVMTSPSEGSGTVAEGLPATSGQM